MTADTAPLTAEEEASLRTALIAGDLWPTAQAASILPVLLATLDHERELRAEAVRSFAERVWREVEALPGEWVSSRSYPGDHHGVDRIDRSAVLALLVENAR